MSAQNLQDNLFEAVRVFLEARRKVDRDRLEYMIGAPSKRDELWTEFQDWIESNNS